ncbi:uncharacterized protein isoform X1 [Rhodnius prolixus]
MNILFRKNFGGEGGGGGGSKDRFGKAGGRGPRKSKAAGGRNRMNTALDDHYGLRTHIFLSPAFTPDLEDDFVGGGPIQGGLTSRRSSLQYKFSLQQKRKPSAPKSDFGDPQVSFNNDNQGYSARTSKPISLHPVPKADIGELKSLDKDCFIIPVASVDRFLPAGVPMPLIETKQSQLSVVEVDDPKLCVLIHLMTQMEPIEPILESPLSMPLVKQKSTACDLLTEMGASRTATEGMLLANLEKNAEFPFISYYVINKAQTDPGEFFHNCRTASLRKFDPKCLRYTAVHTFDLFNEVATIARPPLDPTSKRPSTNATGFIVSVYKVFEGDDREKFEKNWLYWTGARMIYRSLPKSVGLKRITLHKSVSNGDKLYLLLVECSNFLHDLTAAAMLIPALRARLCGYTGLYRTTAVF